jgi:hypothetical protein
VPDARGRIHLAIGQSAGGLIPPELSAPVSSGHCAGPRGADLAKLLPSMVVSPASFVRGGTVFDLSGTRPFGAGGFSGQVISTVKAKVIRPSALGIQTQILTTSPSSGRGTAVRTIRLVVAHLRYRLAPAFGSFTTTIGGAADPACRALDMCAGIGTLGYSFTTLGGDLDLDGEAVVHGREPRGLRAVVAYIARHGGFEGSGALRAHNGQTVERFAQGGQTCADTVTAQPPALDALSHGTAVAVRFDSPDASVADQLRTRCPGPTEDDVIGAHSLAAGLASAYDLASDHPRIVIRGGRSFSGEGFSGSYRGGAVLEMRRVRADIRVRVRR